MTRLLTTREVADTLGVSPATVLRRWRSGDIPGFRIASNCLRFDSVEIDDWLQKRRGSAYSPLATQHPSSAARSARKSVAGNTAPGPTRETNHAR